MYAYAKKYECPRIILLYPKHILKISGNFRFEENKYLHIRTVNLKRNLKAEKDNLRQELTAIINFEKGEKNGK